MMQRPQSGTKDKDDDFVTVLKSFAELLRSLEQRHARRSDEAARFDGAVDWA
jgi:hypothetical protein